MNNEETIRRNGRTDLTADLPLYLAEFDHRRNYRKVTDGERTLAALEKTVGKRLTYKAPIAKFLSV